MTEPSRWAERVEGLARDLDALVLPVTEVAIGSLFDTNSAARIDVVAPPRGDYEAAIDKFGLVERARRLDMDVPRTLLVADPHQIRSAAETIGFPLIAKPRRSRVLTPNGWVAPEVRVVRSSNDLAELCDSWRPADGELLLQEFVPGHGEGMFALCHRGEIRARFSHRRIREKPPLGGVSVLREAIEPSADLLDSSQRLLADLAFTGLAMVEYRRSPEGRLVLMEINPRPWGSIQLAIDAGVDYPLLALEAASGHPWTGSLPRVRVGVRTRWLLGDVDHWLLCARSRSLRVELGRSLAGVTRDFFASFVDGTRLEVLRPEDPRPFLVELWGWLRRK